MNRSHAQGNWIQNIMKSHQVPFLELVKSLDQAFSLRLERKIVAAYDSCCRSVLPCFHIAYHRFRAFYDHLQQQRRVKVGK